MFLYKSILSSEQFYFKQFFAQKNLFSRLIYVWFNWGELNLGTKEFRLKNWSIIVSIHDLSGFIRLHSIYCRSIAAKRRMSCDWRGLSEGLFWLKVSLINIIILDNMCVCVCPYSCYSTLQLSTHPTWDAETLHIFS